MLTKPDEMRKLLEVRPGPGEATSPEAGGGRADLSDRATAHLPANSKTAAANGNAPAADANAAAVDGPITSLVEGPTTALAESPTAGGAIIPLAAGETRQASERQIAANRANALKSTGPQSEEGKRRASENSLKRRSTRLLGLAEARTLHQEPGAFEKLYRELIVPYEPAAALLAAHIEDFARLRLELAAWERIRDARLEAQWQAERPHATARPLRNGTRPSRQGRGSARKGRV